MLLNGSHFLTGSMGLEVFLAPDDGVMVKMIPERRHEGPPGHMHGGFSAALLDEVMGLAVWHSGLQVVSASLTTDFRAPVRLGIEITVHGQVDHIEGNKIHTAGSIILPDGQIAVEGRALFIEMPDIFRDGNPFGSTREG